MQKFMKQEPKK